MKAVVYSALIGAGIALVAFIIDWLGDKLDTPEEAEPLWPASKPYSRSYTWSNEDTPDWADPEKANAEMTQHFATWKLP